MDDMTRFEARFEERLRAFARTGVQSVDSAEVARAVAVSHPKSAAGAAGCHSARRGVRPNPSAAVPIGPWRTRSIFKPSLAVAAVVALLVVGALLTTRRDQPVIGNPSPSVPGHRGSKFATQRYSAGPVRVPANRPASGSPPARWARPAPATRPCGSSMAGSSLRRLPRR